MPGIQLVQQRNTIYFNVKDYGATGNGTTDDTTAIANALAACNAAGGGTVFMPAGNYKITSTLSWPYSTMNLIGAGRAETVLFDGSGGTGIYLITFAPTAGDSGNIAFCKFADFAIDQKLTTGPKTTGGGIHAYGAKECLFFNLHITNFYDYGLWLDVNNGDSTTFGHNNTVLSCLFDNSSTSGGDGGGLRCNSNDENSIVDCQFQFCGGGGTNHDAVRDAAGLNRFVGCTFVSGKGGLRVQDASNTLVEGCTFDGCGFDSIHFSGERNSAVGNVFTSGGLVTANTYSYIVVETFGTTAQCTITGNYMASQSGGNSLRSFIREQNSTSSKNNIVGNTFKLNNALGTGAIELGAKTTQVVGSGGDYRSTNNATTYVNVRDYYAVGDGTTDDTTAIGNAITAVASTGGTVFFPPGTYKIISPLALSSANVILAGAGSASLIQPAATFTGSNIIAITANGCGVINLGIAYANTSYASNPAADGIQITGALYALLEDIQINYINGWAVQSTSTSGVRNKWAKFDNVFSTLCAKGMHIVGVTANNNAAHVVTNCILDQVATGTSNGDGLFIEDCYDIEVSNLECNVSAGSGSAVHIKGRTSSIHITNAVCGGDGSATTGPGVLIESGTNGTPSQIEMSNSIIETANDGMDISAGTEITFIGCRYESNQFNGVLMTGGDGVFFEGCSFNANNQHSGANRFDFTSSTSGNVVLSGCTFMSPAGTGAGQTTANVTVSGGHVRVIDSILLGTPFSGLPQLIRDCAGYTPAGVLGPPTVPASTVAYTNAFGVDCMVYIKGGTVTVISIGGSATGLTLATGAFVTVMVSAGQTITMTYSVAPTWTWFGN